MAIQEEDEMFEAERVFDPVFEWRLSPKHSPRKIYITFDRVAFPDDVFKEANEIFECQYWVSTRELSSHVVRVELNSKEDKAPVHLEDHARFY